MHPFASPCTTHKQLWSFGVSQGLASLQGRLRPLRTTLKAYNFFHGGGFSRLQGAVFITMYINAGMRDTTYSREDSSVLGI